MAEDFPNMGKEVVSQVQVAQGVPGRINPRKNTLRHIVTKILSINSNTGNLSVKYKRTEPPKLELVS